MLKVVDLFSGIGGFSLGLEQTEGFETIAFVEINPFCRKILRKHWPSVPIAEDITKVSFQGIQADIVCGGFPCQDVSNASSTQASILGSRSGLWFEFYRAITEIKPQWVIIENVENLRNKGLSIILQQLAEIGYDAEWRVIPAYAVGLPHQRERLWIIAYNISNRVEGNSPFPLQGLSGLAWKSSSGRFEDFYQRSNLLPSRLCRSIHGLPNGVDRLRAIGNAVVPLIPYIIGKAILAFRE